MRLNELERAEALAALRRCCGATRWCEAMADARPFADREGALAAAERSWWALRPADWREAFAAHPQIGEREAEQRDAVDAASRDTLDALAHANAAYLARFGYIFIICAAGRSAEEMLVALRARLGNDAEDEHCIAAAEQLAITRLRLEPLLT